MSQIYGRDLDLNLLRVFAVVAECGSVTDAAARLYLTQPAVSAALRRLSDALGVPVFGRRGRGLTLSRRGAHLLSSIQAHLPALLAAALESEAFDPRVSERSLRLGLSDASELWLLPKLLHALEREAPRMRVVSVPVQFRNVGRALASGEAELAVTVADDLPSNVRRSTLFWNDFVCLFDPRHHSRHSKKRRGTARSRAFSEAEYFAAQHVIISYNGDLRGIVEDALGRARAVRCSLTSFAHVGAIIDGSALLATVPRLVATQVRALRPALAHCDLPFALAGSPIELLWPAAADDDPANRYLRELIERLAREYASVNVKRPRKG